MVFYWEAKTIDLEPTALSIKTDLSVCPLQDPIHFVKHKVNWVEEIKTFS